MRIEYYSLLTVSPLSIAELAIHSRFFYIFAIARARARHIDGQYNPWRWEFP